jgi:hypothetical protein
MAIKKNSIIYFMYINLSIFLHLTIGSILLLTQNEF